MHVHFSLGGSDWYGVEYDPAQRLFFGYAVLNDDLENAEWGHFSLDELRDVKARGLEIDYDIDWNVRPAREVEQIRLGMRWAQPQDRSGMNAGRPEMTVRLSTKDWYVTQVGRSVEVRDRGTHEVLHVLTPEPEWGNDWGWNITPDGTGVYLRYTGQRPERQ